MTERFEKAARAGDSAKGLRHYLSRLQKARRRGNARKIAKFRPKLQKYKNALEAVVVDEMCRVTEGTVELERGATRKMMREIRSLVGTMVSVQSNLQACAYYAEHTKAIGAGEEWVYPWDEHPVVTVAARQFTPALGGAFYRPNDTSYQLQPSFHAHSTEPEPTARARRAGEEFY